MESFRSGARLALSASEHNHCMHWDFPWNRSSCKWESLQRYAEASRGSSVNAHSLLLRGIGVQILELPKGPAHSFAFCTSRLAHNMDSRATGWRRLADRCPLNGCLRSMSRMMCPRTSPFFRRDKMSLINSRGTARLLLSWFLYLAQLGFFQNPLITAFINCRQDDV